MNNLSMILLAMALTGSGNSKMIATENADFDTVTQEIQRNTTQAGEVPAHILGRTGAGSNVQVYEEKWGERSKLDKVPAEEIMFKDIEIILSKD